MSYHSDLDIIVQQLAPTDNMVVYVCMHGYEFDAPWRPEMRPEMRAAFEDTWKRDEAAYRYLANCALLRGVKPMQYPPRPTGPPFSVQPPTSGE